MFFSLYRRETELCRHKPPPPPSCSELMSWEDWRPGSWETDLRSQGRENIGQSHLKRRRWEGQSLRVTANITKAEWQILISVLSILSVFEPGMYGGQLFKEPTGDHKPPSTHQSLFLDLFTCIKSASITHRYMPITCFFNKFYLFIYSFIHLLIYLFIQ